MLDNIKNGVKRVTNDAEAFAKERPLVTALGVTAGIAIIAAIVKYFKDKE
jgi:hypothetical protein